MSQMTLTLDAKTKPIGLVPAASVVSRLAQIEQSRRTAQLHGIDPEILSPFHCQVFAEDETKLFRSAGVNGADVIQIPTPLVVMWPDYVETEAETQLDDDWRPLTTQEAGRVSRRVLFLRDRLQCMYCDYKADSLQHAYRTLTMDHVKPQRLFDNRSEATTWSNVTSACKHCNMRKGGKLPMECHMYPRATPKDPHYVQLRFAGRLKHPVQRQYVADWFKLDLDEVLF